MTTSDSRAHLSLCRVVATAATLMALVPTPRLLAQDGETTPCERYGTVPVTFVGVAGEPVRRWFRIAPDIGREQFLVTPMTITRNYRGADAPVLYLNLPGVVTLKPGRSYLVYGDNTTFGNAREIITLGAEPKDIEQAADELAFLDAASSNIFGTIHGTLMTDPSGESSSPGAPLSGVTIRFSSDTGFFAQATTDDRGQYTVSGIPEGRVWIEPLLPDGWLMSARSVQARSGGCTPFSPVARLNGRIRGRVVRQDGTPWTWLVDLVRVASRPGTRTARQESVRANEYGEFEFVGLQPGAYLVGVNLLRAPDAGAPYPPTYYPGTTNRDEAMTIVVGTGTLRGGIDVTLSTPMPNGRMDVRVLSTAGPGEAWVCVQTNGGGAGGYPVRQPGEAVTVAVVKGVTYGIVAHVDRPDGHFESDVVEVIGTAGRQVLTLRANTRVKPHPAGDTCHSAFAR